LANCEFVAALPAEEAKQVLFQLEKRPGLPADQAADVMAGFWPKRTRG